MTLDAVESDIPLAPGEIKLDNFGVSLGPITSHTEYNEHVFDTESLSSESSRSSRSPGSFYTYDSYDSRRSKHGALVTADECARLLAECKTAVEHQDSEFLAEVAVQYGFPPQVRTQAWQVLLATHPLANAVKARGQALEEERGASSLPQPEEQESDLSGTNLADLSATSAESIGNPVTHSPELKRQARRFERRFRRLPEEKRPSQFLLDKITAAVHKFQLKWGPAVGHDPGHLRLAYFLSRIDGNGEINQNLLEQIGLLFSRKLWPAYDINTDHVTLFVDLFREYVPVLSNHFNAEDMLCYIENEEWLTWWIDWFGLGAFAFNDVARLWDIYLAWGRQPERLPEPALAGAGTSTSFGPGTPPRSSSGPDFFHSDPRITHIFSCLALLKVSQFKLLEMDRSEIRQFLTHVPVCQDIEGVISDAAQLYEQWRVSSSLSPSLLSPVSSLSGSDESR